MNSWSIHVRRVAVGLVGVVAMGAVALAVPTSASATTTHDRSSVSSHVVVTAKAAPKHSNGWEW